MLSYCLVSSLIRVWIAAAAAVPALELSREAISIARNISERKAEKSKRRRVGRCLGLRVIVPVVGSIIICCRPGVGLAITIPLAEPGAAMYGSLLASGVFSTMEMARKLALSNCFRTNTSSCEKVHSSTESKEDEAGDEGEALCACGELT